LGNASLSERTTFRIGGNARAVVIVPCDPAAVRDAIAAHAGTPLVVLGSGSNVLAADAGYDGIVIVLETQRGMVRIGTNHVDADGSVLLDELVTACGSWGFQGIEQAAGIPGTLAGALVQNAGAYEHSVGPRVESVTCFDRRTRETVELGRKECRFSYRNSVFKSQPDRYIILRARLNFERSDVGCVKSPEIVAALEELGVSDPTRVQLPLVATAVRTVRERKDHLVGPNSLSAGSFFKNPMINATGTEMRRVVAEFERRKRALRADGHDWVEPEWTARRGTTGELIAGSLIATSSDLDRSPDEFRPGMAFGRVRLGRGGPNTIVNVGGATAGEVLGLARKMQRSVETAYKVNLESEVVFLGGISL
jgi:UDP-N-acetylmuramate dehydrogenase